MKAPRKLRRVLTIAAVLLAALVTALPAYAEPPGGGGGDTSGGGSDGNGNFDAWVRSQVQFTGLGYDGSPNTGPTPGYEPPPCWYEPRYDYAGMQEWARGIRFVWHHQGPEDQHDAFEWYTKTLEQIKPHENEPGQVFWFLTSENTDAGWDCFSNTNPLWIYVEDQETIVGEGRPITQVDLAKMARANLSLPDPVVTLNPPMTGGVNRSFVGLETWVHVTPPEPAPLDVTAQVPGLSAQITARPTLVRISVGGADAKVNDGLPTCPEYHMGADLGTGCWVRFNRASVGGPYTITVTQEWEIDSNVVQFDPAEMSTDKTIVVDEIQSVTNG